MTAPCSDAGYPCGEPTRSPACFQTPAGCQYSGTKVITIEGDGCAPEDSAVTFEFPDGNPAPEGSTELWPCPDDLDELAGCTPVTFPLPATCAFRDGEVVWLIPIVTMLAGEVQQPIKYLHLNGAPVANPDEFTWPTDNSACGSAKLFQACFKNPSNGVNRKGFLVVTGSDVAGAVRVFQDGTAVPANYVFEEDCC